MGLDLFHVVDRIWNAWPIRGYLSGSMGKFPAWHGSVSDEHPNQVVPAVILPPAVKTHGEHEMDRLDLDERKWRCQFASGCSQLADLISQILLR